MPSTSERLDSGATRRGFLRGLALSGAALSLDGGLFRLFALPASSGQRLPDLAFQAEPQEPFGVPLASGLDRRVYTDLSQLQPDNKITPPEQFYVRTGVPQGLPAAEQHVVELSGDVAKARQLAMPELRQLSEDCGVHLMECAGNSRFTRFGLISVGQWHGVPLGLVLDRLVAKPGADWVLVEGYDQHARTSTNSSAGCAWVFARRELEASGAFLATGLGGKPLSRAHGSPLRLVVPGWYGCCAVKWVRRIALVGEGLPATGQMREFASRTHQDGVPELAAAFRPALVDAAAMPVRVERWRTERGVVHRVVGIQWGGERSTSKVSVRFAPDEVFVPVSHPPAEGVRGQWTLWAHDWMPAKPGPYLIEAKVDVPGVSTRRLDIGYYVRAVLVTPV